MLADTVYSPVSQQLLAGAHKCLNQDEVDAMKRKLTEVRIESIECVICHFISICITVLSYLMLFIV